MKTKPLVRTLTTHLALSLGPAITASSLFGPQFARAATQTYDDTSAFNIWDASTLNWSNSTSAWTNGNNAIFGGIGKSVTINAATNRIEPQIDMEGKWTVCTPETARAFTAVGYYFVREPRPALNRPIGLISSYWGGTPCDPGSVSKAWRKPPLSPTMSKDSKKI